MTPRLRPAAEFVPVGDEAVLYCQDTGELHRLDPIAASVCARFDGVLSTEALVDLLVEAFGAPREVIDRDVRALIVDLDRRGLLEVNPADHGPADPSEAPLDAD